MRAAGELRLPRESPMNAFRRGDELIDSSVPSVIHKIKIEEP